MTKFAQVLKYNPNHGKDGRFASGMPAGTEGKNAQPPVQGPRSGESQGTSANRGGDPRTDPVKMAPAPATSVSGQDAGGTRSGENKAIPAGGPKPGGSVSGPRSGENAGTPAVSQQNDALTSAAAITGQDAGGTRSGENKGTPSGGDVGAIGDAGGPRSGENKATDGDNASGSTGLTSGTQGHSASTQTAQGTQAPAALYANDIKRGTRIKLRNGWEARMEDNKKGNIRLATVYGTYTEMGSVYTHDITHAKMGDKWQKVQMSPAQEKNAKKLRAMGW